MHTVMALVASFFGMFTMQTGPGGMDMAVMQKWAAAKVIKYHAEGVHNARTLVVFGDYEAKADVLDKVTVDFTWDRSANKIVGVVTVVDAKSVLTNIKSEGTNCPPPELKGDYEHFQSVSNSSSREQIQIVGRRTFPQASVSNYPASCSMRTVLGGIENVTLFVAGAEPEALGMPIMPGGPITIAADRKSFSLKGAENWVWTYTPTLVE